MSDYVLSMLDPFDTSISQPKILDGSVDRSCGIKLKASGTFTLDATGADHYFVLFPGFSHCGNWKSAAGAPNTHNIFPNHLETTSNRGNIKQIRLVSCGVKFSLENSNDENEGFWEAVRIPLDYNQFTTSLVGATDFSARAVTSFAIADMSNYQSYQTGRLRDIDRFLFKLNSVAPDHPHKRVPASTDTPGIRDLLDDFFDVVVIKFKGRVDSVTPSVIRYQIVSNQEVVYQENTQLSRLMLYNEMLPDMDQLLNKTRFVLPSVQVV